MTKADIWYDLPETSIAKYPLSPRDSSKLLVYDGQKIQHESFKDLSQFLSPAAHLVFNNAKVIPARIFFKKDTGATIEVFLLKPAHNSVEQAMAATNGCTWECLIGHKKKWKVNETLCLSFENTSIQVELLANGHVALSWTGGVKFIDLIDKIGQIPLPPYLNRSVENADRVDYQTTYAKTPGAVAAPTAGLHFTERVFEKLSAKGISTSYLTLHVGAGTFKPIKEDLISLHEMHREQIEINAIFLKGILEHLEHIVAVGTTSMRTLESIYWIGVKLIANLPHPFEIDQFMALNYTSNISAHEAISAVLSHVLTHGDCTAETAIFIRPGYTFRVAKGLITNFHQPESTLILLVAALIGPQWRALYQSALENGYRFLSYGDSSLLLPFGSAANTQ